MLRLWAQWWVTVTVKQWNTRADLLETATWRGEFSSLIFSNGKVIKSRTELMEKTIVLKLHFKNTSLIFTEECCHSNSLKIHRNYLLSQFQLSVILSSFDKSSGARKLHFRGWIWSRTKSSVEATAGWNWRRNHTSFSQPLLILPNTAPCWRGKFLFICECERGLEHQQLWWTRCQIPVSFPQSGDEGEQRH